jgi:NAD(P)-dependent dehydrogenase (short-subunit alcohol dehydrogenase family)
MVAGKKVALITGASRGIGRATAVSLARGGYRLALAARGPTALEAVGHEMRAAGAEVLPVPTDVSDEAAVRDLVARTLERFGRIDSLVNGAGYGRFAPIETSDSADWHTTIGANLTGIYFCCKHVVPVMLAQGAGQIVNVLSVAAKEPFPNSTAYCASKFGAYGLTLALAAEVRRRGIRVTAFLPGSVDTPFWDEAGGRLDRAQMLRPEAVGETIRAILEQPEGMNTDEVVLMPPLGIL